MEKKRRTDEAVDALRAAIEGRKGFVLMVNETDVPSVYATVPQQHAAEFIRKVLALLEAAAN